MDDNVIELDLRIYHTHSALRVWCVHGLDRKYFDEIFTNRYLQNLDPQKVSAI